MEEIRPSKVNPLEIFSGFSMFLIILCLLNVSNTYYHGKERDQFSKQYKGGLVGVDLENIMSAHGAAMALNGNSPW